MYLQESLFFSFSPNSSQILREIGHLPPALLPRGRLGLGGGSMLLRRQRVHLRPAALVRRHAGGAAEAFEGAPGNTNFQQN